AVIQENLKDLRDSWFWFLLLGVALIVLGLAVLSYTGMVWASILTAVVFGCFMVVGGVVYIVGAFFTRGWGGFFLSLLAGGLYVVGLFIGINLVVSGASYVSLGLAARRLPVG